MNKKALDFINKEIEGCIKNIDFCKYKGWDAPEHTQRLIDLKKVKEQLEVWEIVKKDFILTWEKSNDASGYYLKYFGDIEYETIKKALEVEDA